jgi:predicted metal-dependent phosphoesterase TrpH
MDLYKYETHLHTSEASACASSTGEEMALAHKKAGYTGIIVTDHFFNGNTSVPENLPWSERIELFCKGYENAKKCGDEIGLQVFFGLEYGVEHSDFLTYGPDKKWLIEHPEIMDMNLCDYIRFIQKAGGMVIQAHPFREAYYIKMTRYAPRYVDGIEVINASHENPEFNKRAEFYARSYDLPVTAGSDTHSAEYMFGGGVAFDHKLASVHEYIKLVKTRKINSLLKGVYGQQ